MKISCLLACIFLILLDRSIANENAEFFNLIDRIKVHPSLENLAFLADEKANFSVSEKSLPDPMLKFGIQNYPSNGQGGFDRYAMTQKTIGITQKIPNMKIRESSAREALIDSEKISLQKELKTQQLISMFVVAVAAAGSFVASLPAAIVAGPSTGAPSAPSKARRRSSATLFPRDVSAAW